MIQIQNSPDFFTIGWNRVKDAPLPVLLLKTCGILAVTLAALRLLSLG